MDEEVSMDPLSGAKSLRFPCTLTGSKKRLVRILCNPKICFGRRTSNIFDQNIGSDYFRA